MTATGKYYEYLQNAYRRYVEQHQVAAVTCVNCGTHVEPFDRMIRRPVSRNKTSVITPSEYCPTCRHNRSASVNAVRTGRTRKWGTFDYTAWAEQTLYPGTPYMQMTWEERQHCYWLARVRWAAEGVHRQMMGVTDVREADADERRKLRSLRLTLARHGRRVLNLPFVEWLDANDYADDHGRATGTPAGGGDDVDVYGHVARAEAQKRAAS